MIKYPSIEQFRNIVHKVRTSHDYIGKDDNGDPIYNHTKEYPKLKFRGTVKLHGTNAGIVKYKDNHIEYQSRERVLDLTHDNAGFMLAMSKLDLTALFADVKFEESIAVFGEWCGSNIQSGVAIAELPKMFVIFGIQIDNEWTGLNYYFDSNELDLLNTANIYLINQFQTFDIEIDFNFPELVQNQLIEWTNQVEECCPVAKKLGVEGIGEGIVFTSIDFPELKFKSKGEKHSVSKVKVLNSVNIEDLNNIQEFVEYSLTEARLYQALSYLKENNIEFSKKSTEAFLRWIFNDILKEEEDTIVKNQIDLKKANSLIATKARLWFFNHIS